MKNLQILLVVLLMSFSTNAQDIAKSRRSASKIAAQGRAVGIHLVIATQRPDRNALDPQTKANLTGKVCFRAANIASSMTILDNKRAFDIPNIKGRAIWQSSNDLEEIQTPFLSEEKAKDLLNQHYRKVNSYSPKKDVYNEK